VYSLGDNRFFDLLNEASTFSKKKKKYSLYEFEHSMNKL